MTTPLACEWSEEKRASVDWTCLDDVLYNEFTFTQLLLAHTRLRAYLSQHPRERQQLQAAFCTGKQRATLAAALPAWLAADLLTLRSERWCCSCGLSGHTRRCCPQRDGHVTDATATATTVAVSTGGGGGTVRDKYRAHQQRLERAKLLAERNVRDTTAATATTTTTANSRVTDRAATAAAATTARSSSSSSTAPPPATTRKELTLFADERRRGVVSRVDAQYGIGFVRVAEYGEVKFFVDRIDFGVRQLLVGEAVTVRVDTSRDYPLAVDVRPERATVTPRDVAAFVQHCQCEVRPMRVLTMLLTHVHEWQQMLRHLHNSDASTLSASTMTTSSSSSAAAAAAAVVMVGGAPTVLCDMVAAVHAFIALVTFVGNREPIHVPVMTSFLQLTLTPVPLTTTTTTSSSLSSSSSSVSFFPDLVYGALQRDAAALTTSNDPHHPHHDDVDVAHERRVHQCIEVVNYIVLLRQYTSVRAATVAPTRRLLEQLLRDEVERTTNASSSAARGGVRAARVQAARAARWRQCVSALRRLTGGDDDALARLDALRLLPRDVDMTRPMPHPASVFTPGNLPVVGRVTYTSAEAYVADQAALLRADTFEAASRLLTAMCYTLPGHTPTAETLGDVAHASLFSHVCARGRVLTRDKDYSKPNSYILALRPASARASLSHSLRHGTTFCISTALDKTTVQPGELFWGVVSSSNAQLLRAGMIVVTPCDTGEANDDSSNSNDDNNSNDDDGGDVGKSDAGESSRFDELMAKLERNERLGQSASSLLLETSVFMTGYAAIMHALRAFTGPLAMPLPMASRLLPRALPESSSRDRCAGDADDTSGDGQDGLAASSSPSLPVGAAAVTAAAVDTGIDLVPPHCLRAFCELTGDVRTRCTLDAGQAEVMRRLPRASVLLVQGPPGTGKSFIGCRVVEVHTRYKQLVSSGDILQKLSIEQLPSPTSSSSTTASSSAAARTHELLPTLGPIVVITYKNHALDEFLVDLLDHHLWGGSGSGSASSSSSRGQAPVTAAVRASLGTQHSGGGGSGGGAAESFPGGCRLVRIGGRSRERRLDPYNLGALLHQWSDKQTIKSLRERLFVMHQRLDRLTREIHYLESGRVPWAYFERWLTAEQRTHMPCDEREAWLAGKRYVGLPLSPQQQTTLLHGGGNGSASAVVAADHYRTLLQTRIADALATAPVATTMTTRTHNNNSSNDDDDDDNSNNNKARNDVAAATDVDGNDDGGDGDGGDDEEGGEDVTRSVFQEMRREDEQREHNDALHRSYLSSEAMRLARNPPTRPAHVPAELQSLWSLDPVTRHVYYAYLIQHAIAVKARDCLTIMQAMASVVRIRNHAMDEAKLALLQGADVVGLTTTGCALNQNLLRSLRPSVLVVEEAAEVLEAQVLACVTDSLRQVVLIGDHYQLQPKVDTFVYEKHNRMNTSLFERLAAQHSEPVIRLTEQRRMHPQLSRLVRPFYAPQPLLDHASLHTRALPTSTASSRACVDTVPGLVSRVFFWRHTHPEEEAPGSRSKVNTQEIRMAQRLVSHLVAQGVLQKSIAVLTPYLGQARMLRSVMRLSSLADVRVSTVDLFQGDEADVVVLSLVRTAKLTEFVRMRNRLIVSCSRARFAMVLMGSDELLMQCDHWARVLDDLRARGEVGTRLPITLRDRPAGEVHWLEVRGSVSAAALTRDLHAEL